jgi:hypothetical protein
MESVLNMPKRYLSEKQKHIYTTPRLNFALNVIKQKTGLPYNSIMQMLAEPLAEIIGNSEGNASFYVMPYGNTITIMVVGKGSKVKSAKLTRPIDQTFGAD